MFQFNSHKHKELKRLKLTIITLMHLFRKQWRDGPQVSFHAYLEIPENEVSTYIFPF